MKFILRLFQTEAAGGIILMLAAVLAMICANTGLAPYYHGMAKDTHFLINDVLMVFFFLLAGLEIKREFTNGTLTGRKALQPLVAAICGITLMMILSVYQRGRKDMFKSNRWKILFTRGIVLAINTVLIMYALKTTPLADFYGMVFVGPIWIAVFSFLFLKETIPPSRWVAILVGFLGVLVIAGPHFGAFNTGYLALLISPIFYAGSAIIARHVGKDEPITNFSLATHSCMAIINLPHAIYSFIMPTLHDFMFMMLYAAFVSCAILGIGAVFARFSQPSLIAPLQYTQMLWGVLFGWMFFGVLPDVSVLAGAGLIIAAGIYILHSARKKP